MSRDGFMRNLSGVIFVSISAIAFGCMPLFAIYAYEAGVDPVTLLFLRFLTAGLFMLLVMLVKKNPFPARYLPGGLGGHGRDWLCGAVAVLLQRADTGFSWPGCPAFVSVSGVSYSFLCIDLQRTCNTSKILALRWRFVELYW
jgi:drug/metabolite transporter (DMT)-like permease